MSSVTSGVASSSVSRRWQARHDNIRHKVWLKSSCHIKSTATSAAAVYSTTFSRVIFHARYHFFHSKMSVHWLSIGIVFLYYYCFCHYYSCFLSFYFLPKRSLADKHENTYTFSATLTYFSRSQTHFCAENPKLHISLSFRIGFWRNFTEMEWTLIWRHLGDLLFGDLLLQVKPEINLKFFCHRFGQIWLL